MDKPDRTAPSAAAPADVESATPRMVGRYEILEEIGQGGMGIVYKARQSDLDRLVALKELRSVHADAPEIVQRFVRESRLAGSLNHPNIVTVHDYVEDRGTSYIAMEYMPRGSLRSWVGDLSLAQLAGVLESLLAGLAAVEPSGIVHRDLKPENVLVTGDGRVKITDFGIAKAPKTGSAASFMTATGVTVGTPAYMAPEQALAGAIGPWTDLYSVGVMTYELLVGRLPFHDSPTPVAILLRHVNEPIPPVIDSQPDVDPALSEWVSRLLVKEPAERTDSATQAWEELEEILIELLGPRWRREARLSERGSTTGRLTPLTPAPFQSRPDIVSDGSPTSPAQRPQTPSSTTSHAAAQPEAESGFLSYGRAPTGIEQAHQAPQHQARSVGAPSDSASFSQRHKSQGVGLPDASLAAGSGTRPRFRARRVGAVTLIAVLTATVGFVLASSDAGTGSGASRGPSYAQASGPSKAYAAALNAATSRLNGVRASSGEQLIRAPTAGAQAVAAERLAQAHRQAATAVRSADPEPPERSANAAIATALLHIASGYAAMAGAARREDQRAYGEGRGAVNAGIRSLTAAYAQLHRLGYRLGD